MDPLEASLDNVATDLPSESSCSMVSLRHWTERLTLFAKF
jgi:hypothetical protein